MQGLIIGYPSWCWWWQLLASFRSLREMEAQEKPLKREPSMEFVTKNFDTLFELEVSLVLACIHMV